jgi:hypothetical protein
LVKEHEIQCVARNKNYISPICNGIQAVKTEGCYITHVLLFIAVELTAHIVGVIMEASEI